MKNILSSIIFFFIVIGFTIGQAPEKKKYNATRVQSVPVIDGVLDEETWKQDGWIDDFTQYEPYNGKKTSQRTEFKIVFDENNLYVAIKAFDSDPDSIVKRLTRRDNTDGDMAGVVFDSFHDLRTGFLFGVSAGGVKFDQVFSNDGDNEDSSWDPNWWVKTSVNAEGWVAEMKIPFSQLRFEKNSAEGWGLEVFRQIYRNREMDFWQHILKDSPGLIHNFGELGGIEEIKPRKIFDVTPYGVAKAETFKSEPGNPFLESGHRYRINGGVDAKIGVTNNMTMDLSVNPDFGQVEADPSVVNLSAFETFFQEKRPFFIEGSNILSFGMGIGDGGIGNDNLFYSRRIGRRPHGSAYEYYGKNDELQGYSDAPMNTAIIGSAKLTGKTKNGLSVGFLDAVTAEEMARIDTGGHRSYQAVEPLTNYLAARVQKDFKEGNTILGGMVTMVNRDMKSIPLTGPVSDNLINRLPESAFAGGLDFTQYFKKKTYMFNVNAAFSRLAGTTMAMVRAQESSARYFQRPGNSISLDSSRTSLSGNGGRMQFTKQGEGHWRFITAVLWKTPGFEINDMGYQQTADQVFGVLWVGYRLWEPKLFYRSVNINYNQYSAWDFSGYRLFDAANINGNINFKNYWGIFAGTEVNVNVKDNTILRGGPVMRMPGRFNYWFGFNSDDRKKLVFGMNSQNSDMFGSETHNTSVSGFLTYKPVNTLNISLSPSFFKSLDELQYVSQTSYDGEPRYIFSAIDQKTISMSLRVNYNLSPDLTLQYWGQPFIASGRYYDFKYITDPMASSYRDRFSVLDPSDRISLVDQSTYEVDENRDGTADYSIGRPDFNVREFLSNFVIRWEFNPGSTVYLVWSQTRDYYNSLGRMEFLSDVKDLFTRNINIPHNIFLVKFSYRFGLR
ncbi:MAG TPA: DUF5916 domain-containing protein [Bacteroidales bacterium]|nr:DUF5916 domain-containing protein [Bacteroidales bacterium]